MTIMSLQSINPETLCHSYFTVNIISYRKGYPTILLDFNGILFLRKYRIYPTTTLQIFLKKDSVDTSY